MIKASARILVLITLAIGWMFLVAAAYYLNHQPFQLNILLGTASTLGDILVAGLLLLLAAAVGRRVLRPIAFETPVERVVIGTGVGFGIVAFVVYALGFLGLIQPLVFWGLVLAGLALLFREILALTGEIRALRLPMEGNGERAPAFFIAVSLGLGLVFALTPPTGWDGIQYHLVFPKLALENGRFLPPPDNLSLSNPALVELLFLAAMGMKSDTAAQVVHWSYLVLTVAAVLMFAARYFSQKLGWLAAAILVAVPSVLVVSTWAYNDAALMFYTLTALFWTLRALETQKARDFVLAGVLAGLALGEKYTALFVVLALGAIVLFQGGVRLPKWTSWRNAFLLGLVAMALAMPWYVRNVLFVGNPIHPFVFGGMYWDAWRLERYTRAGTGLLGEPLELVAAPFIATVQGFQGGYFDATIGALLLAFLPFNLLKRKPERKAYVLRAMWFLAAVLFAFWMLGVAQSKLLFQTRLLFPAFPIFALLAAEGWDRLGALTLKNFSVQRFALMLIGLALILNVTSNVVATVRDRPLEVLLGIETRGEFLTRHLGEHYVMSEWVNANLPSDARIVALWEPRTYYIERTIEADALLDRFGHLVYLYDGDAETIAENWREAGYTHVLLYRAGLNDFLQSQYDPISEREMNTFRELEARHLRLVHDELPLAMYEDEAGFALKDWQAQPYAIYEIVSTDERARQ